MTLQVTTIDPASDPRWDDFVAEHPAGEIYHCSGWLQALREEYDRPLAAFVCESEGGKVEGVLPAIRTRGLPFGIAGKAAAGRLSSLPRTPVAGPIASSPESLRRLALAATDLGRELGVRVQLKLRHADLDGTVAGLEGRPWRPSYTVRLPDHAEKLRFGDARHNATIRRAIRKAEREGVQVEEATSEGELKAWYRLYLDVCRWRAQPARPYRFFAGLWRHLRPAGRMTLLLARRAEGTRRVLVAGNIVLLFGGTATYAFNGRRRDALGSRPNDLLHWDAMQRAIALGYARYDMGEVDAENDGLARYKAKWGAEVEHTMRYYAPPLEETESATYETGWPARTLKRSLLVAWKRVPLALTEFAGEQVYRYL